MFKLRWEIWSLINVSVIILTGISPKIKGIFPVSCHNKHNHSQITHMRSLVNILKQD
jgi:hypothetical protein